MWKCTFSGVAFYFVYTDRIRCAIIKNVRCFETADKSVSGILPHYYGWWEFNRTALAVSKFFVSLKLSIISLPESLPCCYTCVTFAMLLWLVGISPCCRNLGEFHVISRFCHCCLKCRLVATIGSNLWNASTFNLYVMKTLQRRTGRCLGQNAERSRRDKCGTL